MQDRCGSPYCLFWIDGPVGFQINNQLVKIRALLNSGIFDYIGDSPHWTVGCIEFQRADGQRLVLVPVRLNHLIAPPRRNCQGHIQLPITG